MLRIGVLDSGAGGLTTVQALFALRPDLEVVYVADNAHGAYGNKTGADIKAGTLAMLHYLAEQEVQAIAVACNTISSTLAAAQYAYYEEQFRLPIISVIDPIVARLRRAPLSTSLGLIATPFTIKNGAYCRQLQQAGYEVAAVASTDLAGLIEQTIVQPSVALFAKVDNAIEQALARLYVQNSTLTHVVLGCTHYPLVQERFERLAPALTFLNPAQAHAESVLANLPISGKLSLETNSQAQWGAKPQPTLRLSGSGDTRAYTGFVRCLGLPSGVAIEAGMEFKPRKDFGVAV